MGALMTSLNTSWKRQTFLFLFTGWPRNLYRKEQSRRKPEFHRRLIEPERAKRCRRDILATSAIVVVAAVNGTDPGSLEVAGVTANGVAGTTVISLTIILWQAYSWVIRYSEITEDGEWESFNGGSEHILEKLGFIGDGEVAPPSQQKLANWLGNRLAVVGTVLTWCIASWWIWDAF